MALLLLSASAAEACAPCSTCGYKAGTDDVGWQRVPDEPANRSVGFLELERENETLAATLVETSLTANRRIYLAMKWGKEAPVVLGDAVVPSAGVKLEGRLSPPSSARTPVGAGPCEKAEGILLAYLEVEGASSPDVTRDELVGTSSAPAALFSISQRGLTHTIRWESCGSTNGPLPPLALFRDPRLKLALCDEPALGERACGLPILDRTRVASASLTLEAQRVAFSSELVVANVSGETTVSINGVKQPWAATLGWSPSNSPFREGPNEVRITQGAREPWVANLVLPTSKLRPRLGPDGVLRHDAPFTVGWDAAPWAGGFQGFIYPLDVPPKKVGDITFMANREAVAASGVFSGFDDGQGGKRTAPRARVVVKAWTDRATGVDGRPLADDNYRISVSEETTVSVVR